MTRASAHGWYVMARSTDASVRAGILSDVSRGYRSSCMKMIKPLTRALQFLGGLDRRHVRLRTSFVRCSGYAGGQVRHKTRPSGSTAQTMA
jgi:hypothetical protein